MGQHGNEQRSLAGRLRQARSRRREGKRSRREHFFSTLKAMLGIDSFSFDNKVVLVTGGSRGLGLALTRRLARMGARVAMIARDEAELTRAREDLHRRGLNAMAVQCDVRERSQVHAAVRTVTHELGPIDVLINNAGTIQVGPMETMTHEDFDDAMRTNFHGALHMTLAVLPEMRKQGQGRIVNISSVGGVLPAPHLLPYTASKFALTGFSEGLRAELLQEGIVVTTVCPGLMRTGSPYNAYFKGDHRAEFTWFLIADSLPLLSMSAARAARLILRATSRGRASITLGLGAKLASRIHGLLPGFITDRAGLTNRLLPEPNGIGTRRAKGKDSQTRLSSSFLTILSQRAAVEYNQLADRSQIVTARQEEPAAPKHKRDE